MCEYKIEIVDINSIKPNEANTRKHTDYDIENIMKSIKRFGFRNPLICNKDRIILVGNGRYSACKRLGINKIPVHFVDMNEKEAKAFAIMDNRSAELSSWNNEYLLPQLETLKLDNMLDLTGFNEKELNILVAELKKEQFDLGEFKKGSLAEDYIVPPFSVIDTKSGLWREKRQKYYDLFGVTTETRESKLSKSSDTIIHNINGGVSLFDPLLSKVLFNWFCKKNGKIFNMYAGDMEPNLVAGLDGYKLEGVELREEQVNATNKKIKQLELKDINLYADDILNMDKYIKDNSIDLLFSCPPYYTLEHYSEDEKDVSNMNIEDFDKVLKESITKGVKKLKDNRFAVFVISEVRNPTGEYIGFIPKMIEWCKNAGLKYYNEIILVNAIGTLPIRARRSWEKGMKVGRMHQNILVFYKGDDIKEYLRWKNGV